MTDKAIKLGKEVVTGVYYDIPEGLNCGLSKREYFAGLAMQSFLSYQNLARAGGNQIQVAKDALLFADALLEELSKNE